MLKAASAHTICLRCLHHFGIVLAVMFMAAVRFHLAGGFSLEGSTETREELRRVYGFELWPAAGWLHYLVVLSGFEMVVAYIVLFLTISYICDCRSCQDNRSLLTILRVGLVMWWCGRQVTDPR